jgi:hypothetical protein
VAVVARLAEQATANRGAIGFAVSHRPDDGAGWLELLASGLTFELTGLAPARPAPLPRCGTVIGLPEELAADDVEAISLVPGAHLSGGEALLPIVRVHLALAATLSALPNLAAIAWHPAGTWMEPSYFERTVCAWLEGGVFPALGLTALESTSEGGLTTKGLGFFLGRELQMPGDLADNPAETAKLAMRLIHHMVEAGRDDAAGSYSTEQGQSIDVRESDDGRYLEAHRGGA